MASDRHFDTISAVADDVRRGTRSAVSVVEQALDRIASTDAQLNAFVHLDADRALAAAESLDWRIAAGQPVGPLAGVPFGVKDAVDCIGMPTRQGSALYADAPPAQSDSPHVARMRAADAIPIGKTTTSEFGLDSATNTRAHGVTRNPWNLTRTPGGSSGGSAAAVAAGVVPFATAADGGGSTRGPAANCGLVGLKPTHGLIGTSASPDFGVHGFLTYDVLGSARLLDVTAGPTTRDRTSLNLRPDVSFEQSTLTDDVAGLRVAWTTDMGHAVVDPEIAGIAEDAARRLIRAARLATTTYGVQTISAFESWMHSSVALLRGNLELDGHWPSRRDDLSPILQHMLGRYGDSTFVDLALASRQRAAIETSIDEAFANVDVILSPTSACAPWAADGPYPTEIAGRDASTTGPDTMMMIANMCWLPAISVPAGQTSDGLPVGLQMMTRRGDDATLLRLARLLEEDAPWAECPLNWQER